MRCGAEKECTRVKEGAGADMSPDVSLVQQESDGDCEGGLDDGGGLVVEQEEKHGARVDGGAEADVSPEVSLVQRQESDEDCEGGLRTGCQR